MAYSDKADHTIARVINNYSEYKYPLHKALEMKDEEAVRIMINDMKNPNVVDGDGNNALHMAAWHGCSVPLFGRILDKIKDVNAGNKQNRTAITIALAEKHLDLVESLLKVEGIDVDRADNVTGKNALHWASTRLCGTHLYKQILYKIKNVNAKTAYPPKGLGKTALMLAVSNDLRDMVILLLGHPNIDVNMQDEYNWSTALHFAVSYDRRYILQLLLNDERIKTTIKNRDGRTPLEHAKGQIRKECISILEEHEERTQSKKVTPSMENKCTLRF